MLLSQCCNSIVPLLQLLYQPQNNVSETRSALLGLRGMNIIIITISTSCYCILLLLKGRAVVLMILMNECLYNNDNME